MENVVRLDDAPLPATVGEAPSRFESDCDLESVCGVPILTFARTVEMYALGSVAQ